MGTDYYYVAMWRGPHAVAGTDVAGTDPTEVITEREYGG